MGKLKNLTKGNKPKPDKNRTTTKSRKIVKTRTPKQDKKSNLKQQLRKTKDFIERSNLDYDAIREILTMPKEQIKPRILKRTTGDEEVKKDPPVDIENSLDEIENLCRTNILISE